MTGPDIILHAGAPKTGTTSLAYYLWDNEAALNASGVFFPHRFAMRGDVDPLHQHLVNSRVVSKERDAVKMAKERLAEILDNKDIHLILISNESILGEPFEPGNATFYPHALRVAPILAEIFDGHKIDVSFTLRDFSGFLPSYYVQLVRRGYTGSLHQFVETLDLNDISWQRPVSALQQAFGADSVSVFNYADLGSNPAQFAHALFGKRVKADLPPFSNTGNERNQSFGGLALRTNLIINRLAEQFPALKQHANRRRIRRLMRLLSKISSGGKPTLDPTTHATLAAQHKADLKALLG